jgi:filamentous hemagglutinin family protein
MKNTAPASSSANQAATAAVELLPPSITIRVGKRRLTLSWRARKRLPALLDGLLRRSWRQVLAPVLRVSVAAAAVCGAWQTQALAAAPAPGTLPTGWSVVNGNVVFTQNGNVLNINQMSPQAIANFLTFSIGSGAAVNISQPSAAAAFLAKVTGGDISQIYGRLTAPGSVVLFNPNGIMVGAGGVVDVGRFVATTLNINDNDFLAGKLTFAKQGTAGAVENQGTIKSATGGSVYLIGSSVTNGGIIQSPQGEVILAAGQTVTLADTATPGVTVSVTGSTGSVTNLGAITAEAGRIGIAAGLINNSGSISASSVVREGGRVFLRASQNLTTTASSSISADGTVGGNITLYADNHAFIDGDVSATGAPGHGGFVETSGLGSLDVVKAPTLGSGGTWYIDPYDLEVVSAGASGTETSCGTITSNGSGASILNTTINAFLNNGTNVVLATGGANGSGQAGNITVSSSIVKSNGSAAVLTLNADQDILINANITSTSSALGLNLNTNYHGQGNPGATTVGNGARVTLNGGILTASDGSGDSGNGVLNIANGLVDVGTGGTLNAGGVTVGASGNLVVASDSSLHANTLYNSGTVNFNGAGSVFSDGTVTNEQGGTMTFNTGNSTFTVSGCGSWVNNGTFTVAGTGEVVSMSNLGGLQNNGNLTVSGGAALLGTESNTFANSGNLALVDATVSFGNITNNEGGVIYGSGSLAGSNDVVNNGLITPGGNGTIGSLTISGKTFTQNETGEIRVDISSFTNTDQITFNAAQVHFGGTLRTSLLGGYAPALNTSFSPFTLVGGAGSMDDSYFHTVIGDVFTVDGAKQMIKAVYTGNNGGISLAMMGPATFIANGSGADWVDKNAWNNGGGGAADTYLPTKIDTVMISNVSVNHASGSDSIDALIVSGSGNLNMGGGNLTVGSNTSISGNGNLTISGGNLTVGGDTSISGSGSLNMGGDNLTVRGNTSINDSGNLTISAGNMTVGGNISLSGSGSLNMGGDNLTVGGNASISDIGSLSMWAGNLTVAGSTSINDSGSLTVSGGNLTVVGNTSIGDSGRVTLNNGNVTLSNAAIEGGIYLYNGRLVLNGKTTGSGSLAMYMSEGEGMEGMESMEDMVSSKSITMANASSNLNVQINDGDFNYTGAVRLGSLSLSGGGTVNGATGSQLNVASSFYQNGGSLNVDSAALTQSNGTLSIGDITANNLLLQANLGNITQNEGTSLHVTKQLIALAKTGIDLGSACSTNTIAAFAASNSGLGNITLVNRLNADDANVVTINGVYAANGNISIDNTGGMRTAAIGSNADFLAALPMQTGENLPTLASLNLNGSGQVNVANGTATLRTHSPLTIGAGGVNASGGISLTAGAAGDPSSNLVSNGVLSSLGAISVTAGNSLTINADVSAAGGFTATAPLITYAPGVTINNGGIVTTPNPLPSTPSLPSTSPDLINTVAQQTAQQQQNQQTQNLQNSVDNASVSGGSSTGTVNQQASNNTQTVGGTSDNFGDEGDHKQAGKKPLPMCT